MSNREQRNSPPGAHQGANPPPGAARLADELTAVLKLIATQNAEARAAEEQSERSHAGLDGRQPSDADGRSLSDLGQSAAIDRIQDEISALEHRFSGAPGRPGDDGEGEPWDAESAEALTRSYEAAFASAREPQSAGAYRTGTAASGDREWLESRFAGIAAKIESSLAEVRDNSAKQIDGKLGNLEARICEALDSLATRSDLERLAPSDAGFGVMASQFDRAAGQLSRLDTIESNLEAVLDRLSDERFYFDAPRGESRQLDVKALADAAANNVVARLSEMGLGRVDANELTEIRQAIDTIVEERRRHDEQSTAILDTLQQAMISVLDRVDALTHTVEAKYGTAAEHTPSRGAMADVGIAGKPEPSAPAITAQHRDEPGSSLEAEPYHHQPYTSTPTLDEAPRYAEPRESDTARDPFDERFPQGPESQSNLSAIDRIRQDLIADAKRAKQQATERAAQTMGASHVAADLPGAKVVHGEGARKKRPKSKPAPASSGTLFGVQRRKLLVGAVIVLFATAGALMMMRATSSKAPAEAPTAIEQPTPTKPGAAIEGRASETQPAGQTPGNGAGNGSSQEDRTGASPNGKDASANANRAMAANLRGVTLQSSRMLTPEQYEMLSEKQAMAHFSEKLGEAAALATPAAVFPQAEANSVTSSPLVNSGAGSVAASRAPLNLPPATVGPMSLRLAAAKGDPSAEFEVGLRLAEGTGTNQDFKEAARWYQRSASQGFAQAQYRLGTLYERGLGMPRDLARAAVWYQRAADNGNVKAMHNLAVLSAGKDAGEAEYAAAARWFTEAAERGLADSQYNLAILHENGLGTAKDLKQAYKYFALAARSGDQQAKRRQEMLARQLSVEDRNAAEGMLESWRRKSVDRLANDAHAAGEDWKSRADNRYGG